MRPLTVDQTVGAVFQPHAVCYAFKLGQPDAKATVYRILANERLVDYHENALFLLAFLGEGEDAKHLAQRVTSISGHVSGKAGMVQTVFQCLGIMSGRRIDDATRILDQMLTYEYWEKYNLQWFVPPQEDAFSNADNTIRLVFHGYLFSRRQDHGERIQDVLSQITNQRRRRAMEECLSPTRIAPWLQAIPKMRLDDKMPVLESERKKYVSSWNLNHANPLPIPVAPDVRKRGVGSLNSGDTDANEASASGRETPMPDEASQTQLAKLARLQFDEIRERVAKGEFAAIRAKLLDGGRLMDADEIRMDDAEFIKGLQLEQRILESLGDIELTFLDAKWLQEGKPSPSGDAEVRFKVVDSANIRKQAFRGGGSDLTVAADGSLMVLMKRIKGKWYWNPFGW